MSIEEWWPRIDPEVRYWIGENMWNALAPFHLQQIELAGGPSKDSDYWLRRPNDPTELFLPPEAVQMARAERSGKKHSNDPDPRAAYFKRSWPRR